MRLAEAEDLKVSEMALTGVSSKKKVPVRREVIRMVGIWLVHAFVCGCFRAAIFWEGNWNGALVLPRPWFRVGKQYAIYIYLLFMKGTLFNFMIHCEPVSCQDSRYTHSIHFKQQ